jgi:hypothetical protein
MLLSSDERVLGTSLLCPLEGANFRHWTTKVNITNSTNASEIRFRQWEITEQFKMNIMQMQIKIQNQVRE